MLLKNYRLEILNSECKPSAMSVHCYAHLDQDVGKALPYLNTVLGGFTYIIKPPSVTFRAQGKLITVHRRKIAVNALKDETEARKIVEWLRCEINDAWENRATITPSETGQDRPTLIKILQLLPRTNCKKCGQPTCMVFATQMMDGGRYASQCPELTAENKAKLSDYLADFDFE